MDNLQITGIVLLLGMLAYGVYSLISSTTIVKVSPDEPQQNTVELASMTKPQLLEYAKSNGIKVDSRSKKADIITSIESAQS